MPLAGTDNDNSTTISIIYSLSYPDPLMKPEHTETTQSVFNDGNLNLQSVYDVRHILLPLSNLCGFIDADMIWAAPAST